VSGQLYAAGVSTWENVSKHSPDRSQIHFAHSDLSQSPY